MLKIKLSEQVFLYMFTVTFRLHIYNSLMKIIKSKVGTIATVILFRYGGALTNVDINDKTPC